MTHAQLSLYTNDPIGKESYNKADAAFQEWYDECKIYNLVCDNYGGLNSISWDEEAEQISANFPIGGTVYNKLLISGILHEIEG